MTLTSMMSLGTKSQQQGKQKQKNKQLRLHQTKELLQSKRKIFYNEKTFHRMQESNCKSCFYKGVNIPGKKYKNLLKLNNKKVNNPIQK